MAEVAQRPPQAARGEPVLVVVDNDVGILVDASFTHGLFEQTAIGKRMSPGRRSMPGEPVGFQVDEDGTCDMAGFISGATRLAVLPTEVDDAQARIVQAASQPR